MRVQRRTSEFGPTLILVIILTIFTIPFDRMVEFLSEQTEALFSVVKDEEEKFKKEKEKKMQEEEESKRDKGREEGDGKPHTPQVSRVLAKSRKNERSATRMTRRRSATGTGSMSWQSTWGPATTKCMPAR